MELAGILLVLLGLPWSLIAAAAVIAAQGTSAVLFTAVIIGGCVLNTWLLYRIGRARHRITPS
jgi:hypothetical protein